MKKGVFMALCAFLLIACGKQSGYVITGTVDNADLNGKTVYLYEYGIKDGDALNNAIIENGKFTIKGDQATPLLCVIRFNEEVAEPKYVNTGENAPYTATFVLENGKLKIDLSENPAVTGTPENDALASFQKEMKQLRSSMEQIIQDMNSEDGAIADAAEKKYDEIEGKVAEAVKTYIQNNPDKLTSAKLLYDFRYNLDEDTRRNIIGKAGDTFKSVVGINKMIDHLAVLEKVGIGKTFTDFEMKTPEGEAIKLSDNVGKGKVTLIDFWASWCPPCRKDIPHLVELYKQYKDNGFEIVGVSLDRTNDAWIKGITELNITWPQMSDLKYWQSEGAALYGVNSIPHTVLVDKDGIIIAKNVRGEALDAKLAEVLK
ncbi:MAG: AhpC/TSA family protein [Tannerellaceae bacterium]|jgi:thiol-disulfide isomerase/thioredoxin|nr:AhpC/TSA family protein [Tannerellaceae bacterium]